jgi:hypothetical protein
MDAVWIYVALAILVVIVPVLWLIFGRRLRAKARAAGTSAGFNLEDRVATSTRKGVERDAAVLGTRFRFPAGSDGRAIVTEGLAGVKAATATGATSWSLSHGIPDMISAEWRDEPDGGGTFLAVRARQAMGSFVQKRTWSKALYAITAAAVAHQVTPQIDYVPLVRSDETVEGDPIWIAAA